MRFFLMVFLMKIDTFLLVLFLLKVLVFLFWSACNPSDADPSAMDCTAIGLKSKDGVVLAVEKCVTSPLLVILHLHLLIYIVSVKY